MRAKKVLTLLVVVGLLVPAAGVVATAQSNSTPTSTPVDSAGDRDEPASTDRNYTRLYIDDRHEHLELKPGETDTFTVTVENGEDEPTDVSPRVYIPPRGERPIEEQWVSIQGDDTALGVGEEREYEITVSIPESADLNRYGGLIAFSDETVTYPGRPEQPVHAVSLNVEVWREPTVLIHSDRHMYTQVKAGDSFTREIVVENTGQQAVPVNPQLNAEDRRPRPHYPPGERETLDRSWLEVDAPTEIAPGETARIEVTLTPPASADRGDYRAELDLGIRDPARPDRSSHWQEVGLRFQVWDQPEEPFRTSFEVTEDAENITLELSAGRPHRGASDMDPASFDVTFVAPDGTETQAERIRVANRGSVDLGGDRRQPRTAGSTYSAADERQTFRYRVEEPEAGSWTVRIMPENTVRFGYEIVRHEGR